MLIVLRPGISGLGIGEILALAGAFLTALVIIVVKQMSRTEPSNAIVAYMVLLLTPMSLVTALPFWSLAAAGHDWPFVIGMGMAGTRRPCLLDPRHLHGRCIRGRAVRLCAPDLHHRHRHAGLRRASRMPTRLTGSGIIVLAGIYIARREAMLNQRAAREAVAAAADPSRTGGQRDGA